MKPEVSALIGGLSAIAAIPIICWILRRTWAPLESRFPSVDDVAAPELKFRSFSVQFSRFVQLRFGLCAAFKLTDHALHIRIQSQPIKVFRPISVPWADIETIEMKRIFGISCATVRVKNFSPFLRFSLKPAKLIYEKWNQVRSSRA